MNKQKMAQLHRRVCRGGDVPDEMKDDYREYVEQIAPPLNSFKPVPFGKTGTEMMSSEIGRAHV